MVFSGWVGDQDPTFIGLKQALLRYLQSGMKPCCCWRNIVASQHYITMVFDAQHGQAMLDSDRISVATGHTYLADQASVGASSCSLPYTTAYMLLRSHDGPPPFGRTKELFIRWFQLGAFSPLMENGGDGEHRPWAFNEPNSTDCEDLYRLFVTAHMSLVPYLLNAGAEAYAKPNGSIIVPLAPHNTTAEIERDLLDPETFAFLLGDSILVVSALVLLAPLDFACDIVHRDFSRPSMTT